MLVHKSIFFLLEKIMDESNNLILNIITEDSSINEKINTTSLRSKLKNVGGSWKEKKKIRKSLKKNLQKHALSFSSNKPIQKNNSEFQDNTEFQNNLNSRNKTQIISSIFSYNPEIPNVSNDNDLSTRPTDNKPSNAPIIGDTSLFISMGLDSNLVENMKNKFGVEKPTNIQ